MSSLPRTAHVPATPADAPVYALPISQELADLLAPRVMRSTQKHLRAVTHRQNVLRSRTNPYAVNARRRREREEADA